MSDARADPFPRCAECGDVVGVYEPMWLELDDGSVCRSSLLALGESGVADRVWHAECLGPGANRILAQSDNADK